MKTIEKIKAFVEGNNKALSKWDKQLWYIKSEKFPWTYMLDLANNVYIAINGPVYIDDDTDDITSYYESCCVLDSSKDIEEEILEGLVKLGYLNKK